ncbi:transposase family protein, partial [Solirubrobacter sp. CPCC 204708]|nr:transposase family protein [Solirubrobacter deserti]
MIKCIKENIIHRFGLPQTITADQGSVFTGSEIKAFSNEYGFEIIHSTPYYAQANGQAESTNKILKLNIEKMVENNPRIWHELLSETLWAYRNSKRSSTGVTPFELTFGHDA